MKMITRRAIIGRLGHAQISVVLVGISMVYLALVWYVMPWWTLLHQNSILFDVIAIGWVSGYGTFGRTCCVSMYINKFSLSYSASVTGVQLCQRTMNEAVTDHLLLGSF